MCRVGTLWTGSPKLSQAIFSPSSDRWWQMSATHLTCFPRSGQTFSSVAICIPLASTNLKSETIVRGRRRLLAEAPRLCSHPPAAPSSALTDDCDCASSCNHVHGGTRHSQQPVCIPSLWSHAFGSGKNDLLLPWQWKQYFTWIDM